MFVYFRLRTNVLDLDVEEQVDLIRHNIERPFGMARKGLTYLNFIVNECYTHPIVIAKYSIAEDQNPEQLGEVLEKADVRRSCVIFVSVD